ncbi:tetratricopeptide repeat protein [Paraburkholderia bengalensis]|uniref:protein O-GlcNAc transferase n=2 Tax=Paraburkholderia bengalensis TaxID=2747562 RepID=A0ABU8J5A3_9BURK
MHDIAQQLTAALDHHQAGRLQHAQALYDAILHAAPGQCDALHFSGMLACQTGRADHGLALMRASIAANPNAVYYNNLANALREAGLRSEAIEAYRRATQLKPDYAQAHSNLGNALREAGDARAAKESCEQAIALLPDYAEAHNNLGNALKALGDLESATLAYRKAVSIRADYAEALSNLGHVEAARGRLHESADAFRRTLALVPRHLATHESLSAVLQASGDIASAIESLRHAVQLDPADAARQRKLAQLLREQRRFDEAEQCLTAAIARQPNDASGYAELGDVYQECGKIEAAVLCYRAAADLSPGNASVHHRQAVALLKLRRADEAIVSARRAVALDPASAVARINLGDALSLANDADGAIEAYRQGIALDPELELAHNRLLFDLATHAPTSPLVTLAAAREFGQRMTTRAQRIPHARRYIDGRPLRIGFVSGDLMLHPVGIFLESVMQHFADGSFELVAYPTQTREDDITARLKPRFAAWRSIAGLGDAQAAHLIREDAIDILVDLSGHTVHNRLPVFAWKPAPLQVSWLGYFGTTGLPQMDYVLGDRFVTPVEEASHYLERLWRLPDSYLCFTPPDVRVEVGPLPALANGHPTFGYFGKLVKVTPHVIGVWSRILHAVPDAKLMLKAHELDAQHARRTMIERFARHDIDASRLILEGGSPREAYLAAYNRVDIVLSPFPYPGGTTTAEALWMGAPVLALKGDRFVTHICESLLHAGGLPEWIAADESGYVDKAVAFAAQREPLAALRARLRGHVLTSPLCDARRYASNLKEAFEGMWAEHVASGGA